MKKIIAIIQARISSTRLPKKVLLKLEGKAVLERVIERVQKSDFITKVAVATTTLKEDSKIVKLCAMNNVGVYRGSKNDVLDRYFQAAKYFQAGHIVRVTADCPLIDHRIIDKVIKLHLLKKADYTSNVLRDTFPDGEDVEIFSISALEKSWREARLASDREHVTTYIRHHPEAFKLVGLTCTQDYSKKRWTMDEKADYRFIRLIYRGLYKKDNFFGMDKILSFLKKHKEYEKINNKIMRNEGYLKSLKKDHIKRAI